MNLDSAIQKRRSIREYKNKEPSWRKIIEAIDATRYAPCAGGNFSMRFILVTEPKTIQKLADATQQDFVASAPYVVVACSDPKKTNLLFKDHAKIYTRQQAGAAMQNFMLKITERGLATCWVAIFDEHLAKESLKIPEDIDIEAIFPIGIAAHKEQEEKKLPDLDNILFFNEYKNKKLKSPKQIYA